VDRGRYVWRRDPWTPKISRFSYFVLCAHFFPKILIYPFEKFSLPPRTKYCVYVSVRHFGILFWSAFAELQKCYFVIFISIFCSFESLSLLVWEEETILPNFAVLHPLSNYIGFLQLTLPSFYFEFCVYFSHSFFFVTLIPLLIQNDLWKRWTFFFLMDNENKFGIFCLFCNEISNFVGLHKVK